MTPSDAALAPVPERAAADENERLERLGYTQRWIWGGFGVDLGWIPVYISKRTNFYNKSTAVLRVLLFTQNA